MQRFKFREAEQPPAQRQMVRTPACVRVVMYTGDLGLPDIEKVIKNSKNIRPLLPRCRDSTVTR